MLTAAILPCMSRKPLPVAEKKAPIAGRIDPSLLAEFAALAAADDRKLSYMVEKAVRLYVEWRKTGKLPPKKR